MSEAVDRSRFVMRAPCRCGLELGTIVEVNGQDTVRCLGCNAFQYNAPRTETGRAVRSSTTVHNGIRPHVRSRILERDGYRCLCGHAGGVLHVGHMISVAAGLQFGVPDDEINDDENLVTMCEECNLGQGALPISLRLAVVILRARIAWRNKQG